MYKERKAEKQKAAKDHGARVRQRTGNWTLWPLVLPTF